MKKGSCGVKPVKLYWVPRNHHEKETLNNGK